MVSDNIMTVGVQLLLFCLVGVPAFGQHDRDKLSPQKLQELIDIHQQAAEELRRAEMNNVSGSISYGFLNDHSSVAIVEIGQVKPGPEDRYDLDLNVERVLRGKLPQQVAAQCYWSPSPLKWIKLHPPGLQRMQPKTGRRILAEVQDLPYDAPRNERRFFVEILNLDNPAEAAFLPQAQTAADMEASASAVGLAAYEKGLTSDSSAVRDLALFRLLYAEKCPGNAQCEASIHAAARILLASKNVNERMEAVRWLQNLSEAVGFCQIAACDYGRFQLAPVRLLLQTAVTDQNVAIGDLAFQFLAALDFHKKKNDGWCEEILPEIRTVKRYRDGTKHTMSRKFYSTDVCITAEK